MGSLYVTRLTCEACRHPGKLQAMAIELFGPDRCGDIRIEITSWPKQPGRIPTGRTANHGLDPPAVSAHTSAGRMTCPAHQIA